TGSRTMGRVPQSRMSMSGWAAIACASQKGDSIAQRLAAASAVSRRDVQIATTSTPGTERHAGRWAKAPQFALMIPTLTVIGVFHVQVGRTLRAALSCRAYRRRDGEWSR